MNPPDDRAPVAPALPAWKQMALRLRRPIIVVAGVGTVLGGLAGYLNAYRAVRPPTAAAAPPAPAAAQSLSLAVMPMDNLTGDPAKAYVADGLTTVVSGNLARLAGIVVVPASTALALRTKGLTLAQLGSEARVRFVLQGGVQSEGDRVRITATLSDTQGGVQLWSKTFEGRMTALFELQDQVTAQIRVSVAPTMVAALAPEAERRQQTPQAADLILRAQALLLQPRTFARQQGVVKLYRQALDLEPNNLQAMAGLARHTTILVQSFSSNLNLDREGRIAMLQPMAELARKVLATDPDNLDQYAVLSELALYRGDVAGAKQPLMTALERAPAAYPPLNALAVLHTRLGEGEAAYAWGLKALESPVYGVPWPTYNNLRAAAWYSGRWDDAVKWARKAVEGNPDYILHHARLAISLALAGDVAGAQQAGAETLRREPGFLYADTGLPWPQRESEYWNFQETRIRPALRVAGLTEKR